MTIADAIGIVRALAVAPIAWAVLTGMRPLALVIFVVAALTDALDGWIARRTAATTAHGALIDPLADKVLTVGVLAALAAANTGWPVTVDAVLVGARELAVAVLRIAGFRRGSAMPADGLAKVKTAAELIGIAMIIWGGRPWAVLGAGIVGLAFLVSLYTVPRYVRAARGTA